MCAVAMLAVYGTAASPLVDYQRVLYLTPPPTFNEADGLVQCRDGTLLGTLHSRVNYGGVLFRVGPDGSGYTALYSSVTNRPSGVIEGRDGRLYGTIGGDPAASPSGVFSVASDGGNFMMLRTSSFPLDRISQFGVVQDDEGWLFGTTSGDGFQNGGTVFKLATDGTGFRVLHEFRGLAADDGLIPGALTVGRDGWLYGCTFFGGSPSNVGTIFRLRTDGSGYAVLHRFGGSRNGRYPSADQPLLEGSDGFLYGAADGGINSAGVIFKLNKSGNGYQVIHEFEGENGTGDSPIGGLVEWCDGALYGATYEGGIDGAGMLFRINKDGSAFATLHTYIDAPNPEATEGTPRTRLLPATDGRLYGLTSGGVVAEGTVFRITPLPSLRIRTGPEEIVVSWPDCSGRFELEESNQLGLPDGWTRVDAVGEVIESVRHITLPRNADRRFFRLNSP